MVSNTSREWPLKTRLVLVFASLVSLVVATMGAYFIYQYQRDLRSAMENTSLIMRADLVAKGKTVTRNVTLAAQKAIGVMDFLYLDELIASTASSDKEIAYAAVMDGERRALVHSIGDKSGKVLENKEAIFAAKATELSIQNVLIGEHEIIEVVNPILVGTNRWTLRLGMSLNLLNAQISENEALIKKQIQVSVITLIIAALVFLTGVVFVTFVVSGRISDPLIRFTERVQWMGEHGLEGSVSVGGSTELVDLGNSFNQMAATIRSRNEELKENNRQLEEALHKAEEANRLKSEFLANVSHELRTPLNTIVNVPHFLLKDYELSPVWICENCDAVYAASEDSTEDQAEPCPECNTTVTLTETTLMKGNPSDHVKYLERLTQQGKHLLRVVNDVLDFSKLEAGKMELTIGKASVMELVRDACLSVERLAATNEITVNYETSNSETSPHFQADPVRITQVLLNLLDNAIKFTPPQGSITAKYEEILVEDDPYIQIQVTDTGVGIASDKLEGIFESFHQADSTHTRKYLGTGLGLTISRQMVELHSGKIWIESDVDKGTTVFVNLPKNGPFKSPKNEPTRLEQAIPGTNRVMVVDDNPEDLRLAGELLEERGFEVSLINDSTQAMFRIKEELPLVIILDVLMPDLDGISLLKRLKESKDLADTPVLVSSAFHASKNLVDEYGGIWLAKPWNPDELTAIINQYAIRPQVEL